MNADDLFGPIIDLKAKEHWEAIDELIGHLIATGKIEAKDRDAITDAVKKREREHSTGIGHGIALPHTACDFVREVVVTVGRSRDGIQFDSIDGALARTVCLFLVPTGHFQQHVNTLANIAKLLPRIERDK
jgi:mannitol/fructose-specific phosphotransferase system IIA component (Ntr-type)